jgi:hypothetical protein
MALPIGLGAVARLVGCGGTPAPSMDFDGGAQEAAVSVDPSSPSLNEAGGPGPKCGLSSADQTGCPCDEGQVRACYTGPSVTRTVGACHDGTQTCVKRGEFGMFGPCTNESLPSTEHAHCTDGIDNDCNKQTDCADLACANDPACASRLPTDGQLVLFGGEDSLSDPSFSDADTWMWNGTSWTRLKLSGPSPRGFLKMATSGSSALLFGGQGNCTGFCNSTFLNDTWTWNGTGWTQQNVTGPSARDDYAIAALGGTVVLFGGYNIGVGSLSDTWTWNGASWTQQNGTGPSARNGASMATLGSTVVLFGGALDTSNPLGDTWEWNGTSWMQQNVSGPSPRYDASVAALGGTVLLYGGTDTTGVPLSDTWTWNGMSWTQQNVTGPSPRRSAPSMATLGSTVVLFGGQDEKAALLGDTWTWNGTSWTQRNVAGPSPRAFPAMAASP